MRRNRWLYLLLITTMLLSSCQAKEPAASDSEPHPSLPKVNPLTVSVLAQQASITTQLEPNECLNCHEDKERLIETTKEEEVAEAESSGVG